jgi:hypothetical protein
MTSISAMNTASFTLINYNKRYSCLKKTNKRCMITQFLQLRTHLAQQQTKLPDAI